MISVKGDKVPYRIFEATEGNKDELNEIWDEFWSKGKIDKEVSSIETNSFLGQYKLTFLQYLPKKGKILEGGCGLGQWAIYLRRKGYDIVGVDYAAKTVRLIKAYNNNIPVEIGDITKTRFNDGYFDAYISLGVVEHFLDGPFMALEEARRILKKEGLLLISVPVLNLARLFISPLDKIFCLLRENIYVRKLLGKTKYPQKFFIEYRYTIKEFEAILREEGYGIIKKIPILETPNNLFNFFLSGPSFLGKSSILYKIANIIAKSLEKISKWIAPHVVIWICRNRCDDNNWR